MPSTNSTGVLSRLIRVFWYAVFLPALVGRRRLSTTVVLTKYANLLLFPPPLLDW